MQASMKQKVHSAENRASVSYNRRPLIRCEATYLGSSLPTKTSQPPGIVYEPLEKICERESLPTFMSTPKKRVQLHLFHSGVVIELLFGKHNGELVWYPIQNLYCSAGILPFKTKSGKFEFRSLDDQTVAKSPLKPLFSIVFREAVHKKVLQCHAFAVKSKELSQLLVQATVVAYRDRNGWNQPMNNSALNNRHYNYSINIVEEVHIDSGYSDHEESSQQSSQSPQSSILSTEVGALGNIDNHGSQTQGTAISMPSSTTPSQTTLVVDAAPSIRCQSPTLGSLTDQSDMPAKSETNEENEDKFIESSSISSGYPISRNSSVKCPIQPQASPQCESKESQQGSRESEGKLEFSVRASSSNVEQNPNSTLLESSPSLSIKPPSKHKTPQKPKKSNAVSKLGLNNALNFHQHNDLQYQRASLAEMKHMQGYRDLSYVPYHPDQFMYRGDRYIPQLSHPTSTEQHNKAEESAKKSVKSLETSVSKEKKGGYMASAVDNRMEQRLTKKSIPRQLL
ncbi:uncharacterized protein [Watersipora subatra]|uniref:uncharacterized protein n=1 Tax=Watersipora subatra TaxID=2589382 RepID=UPI00355C20BE